MKKAIIGAVLITSSLIGCSNDEDGTPYPRHYQPTTPANVLQNIAVAFNDRHDGLLKDMINDDFVFYFDPRDVGSNPPGSEYLIPESWTRAEFLKAATNMFKKAYQITLTIYTDGINDPRPEETEYGAENVPAELLVMIEELNGYMAKGSCAFEFERYSAEGGSKCWRLTAWRDGQRFSDGEPENKLPSTIGRVLASFYTR